MHHNAQIGNYEVKFFKNAFWLKLFFHNMTDISNGFSSNEEALHCNSEGKYSILSELNESYKIQGRYEFLLEYPEIGDYNRWLQTNRPFDEVEKGDRYVEGYIPKHIGYSGKGWGGLLKTNINASSFTLINGSPESLGGSNWFYAIGKRTGVMWNDYYRLPGPIDSEMSFVYLWVRIPFYMTKITSEKISISFTICFVFLLYNSNE